MKSVLIFAAIFFAGFGLMIQVGKADVNVGLSIGDEGIKQFYLSIGDHYGVQERSVEKVNKRSIPDDELAVVFYLARHSGTTPMTIVDFRLDGKSWMEISNKLGLNAGIYYVPFDADPGPPYGRAYGHFKNKPKKHWHKVMLDDDDIINLVNLKFITSKYNCSPEDVIKLRKQGKNFANINANVKKDKEQKTKVKSSLHKKQSGNKNKDKKGKENKK